MNATTRPVHINIMSFFNIKDPKKRDAVVADYLATVKRLQQRNLNEKAQDLARDENLKEIFNPVVQSTAKSTELPRVNRLRCEQK